MSVNTKTDLLSPERIIADARRHPIPSDARTLEMYDLIFDRLDNSDICFANVGHLYGEVGLVIFGRAEATGDSRDNVDMLVHIGRLLMGGPIPYWISPSVCIDDLEDNFSRLAIIQHVGGRTDPRDCNLSVQGRYRTLHQKLRLGELEPTSLVRGGKLSPARRAELVEQAIRLLTYCAVDLGTTRAFMSHQALQHRSYPMMPTNEHPASIDQWDQR